MTADRSKGFFYLSYLSWSFVISASCPSCFGVKLLGLFICGIGQARRIEEIAAKAEQTEACLGGNGQEGGECTGTEM